MKCDPPICSYMCELSSSIVRSGRPQLAMQSDLFGPSAKFLSIPSEIENESDLLHGLRLKTGPHSDTARLLHHIRGARGKLHWAGEISYYLASRPVTAPQRAFGWASKHTLLNARAPCYYVFCDECCIYSSCLKYFKFMCSE